MPMPRLFSWTGRPEPVEMRRSASLSFSPHPAMAGSDGFASGERRADRAPGPFLGFLAGTLVSAAIWAVVAGLCFFL